MAMVLSPILEAVQSWYPQGLLMTCDLCPSFSQFSDVFDAGVQPSLLLKSWCLVMVYFNKNFGAEASFSGYWLFPHSSFFSFSYKQERALKT